MYMGKIEAPVVIAAPPFQAKGSVLLGLAMLAIAMPIIVVRLLAHFVVRDIRLVGRAARAYAECVAVARRTR
jgi:hypothetical protein